MKKALCLIAVFLVLAGALTTGQQAERARTVPGQYIVVFRDTVADVPGLAFGLAAAHGSSPRFVYEHALKGFAAELPEQAAEALSRNPNVAYVEPDSVVWAIATQSGATWGLDRIDQRALPLDSTYEYVETGYGVTAYIIDTGIRFDHSEFGGRAVSGFDAIDGGSADDCNGHGTHVAGTVGGGTYGVAKDVRLVAVRVLGCDGSGATSGVIAGIDWVTANATAGRYLPAVANMSLGGGASASLDTAVRYSIAAGVSYAVAAGNGNFLGIAQNACNYSPARVAEAMTIGATNNTDTRASWSNYGDCVDWFAPGVGITSAWSTSPTATNTIGGTSMATPHTAGVAALYLQAHSTASPQEVREALFAAATKAVVLNSKTVNNHLLYSLFGTAPPDNQPPVANFTHDANGLTVAFTDTSTDSGGSVVDWSWAFGDGGTSSAQNPIHIYSSAGIYTVSLTVIDDDGASSVVSKQVTVSDPTVGITLTATGFKVKGVQSANLSWSGATGTSVDVFRDGSKVLTTANDGTFTDNIGKKGGGTYTYKVCEAGTSTCSNTATIVF
jgi:subtilisin family serine protease